MTVRGAIGPGEAGALTDLDLAWGDAYDLGVRAGQWWARRLAGDDGEITASSPAEMDKRLRHDWAREGTISAPRPDKPGDTPPAVRGDG